MKERIKRFGESKLMVAIAIPLIALFVAFAASNNPLSIGNIGKDSAVFQYVARVILNGGMPYCDSFDHKGPFIYLFDAVGLMISPAVGIWLLEWLFLFVTVAFMYKMARLLGCKELGAVIAAFVGAFPIMYYLEGGNLVEEYACPFIAISLYVFARFFILGKVRWYEVAVCGASFGIVALLRINMVVLWGVMCIGVLVYCLKKKSIADLFGYFLLFLGGAIIVIAPVLIWLERGDALKAFFDACFVFNAKYAKNAGSLSNIVDTFISFSRDIPVVICVVLLGHRVIERRTMLDVLCVVSLFFSLLSMSISGIALKHYGMILCPIIAYAIASLFSELSGGEANRKLKVVFPDKIVQIRIILLKTLMLCFGMIIWIATHTSRIVVEKGHGLEEIVNVVQTYTDQGETITVCGNRDIIYIASERESFSLYSYQSPLVKIDESIKQAYFDGISRREPSLIVISTVSDLYKEIVELIAEGYYKVGMVQSDLYITEIYRRNDENEGQNEKIK